MKNKVLGFAVGVLVGFVGCLVAGLAVCEYAEGFGEAEDADSAEQVTEYFE